MNFSKNQAGDDDVPFQKIGAGNNEPGAGGKKDSGFSSQTRDKVEAAKSYIESSFLFFFEITTEFLIKINKTNTPA